MMPHGTGRRLRLTAGAAALLVLLTGCGAAGTAPEPPAATSSQSAPSATPTAQASPSSEPEPDAGPASAALAVGASTPVRVSIPTLEMQVELIETGMRADGTLEVPPGEEGSPGSWYDGSPTPGERGASVLLGQVNSTTDESGPFYELPAVQQGDEIVVEREDGSTAIFRAYRIESFDKDEFPTRDVYYPVPGAELRLITCDNPDGSTGSYPNNLIVFAELVEVRQG